MVKLTVGFSQSAYTLTTYRVVAQSMAKTVTAWGCEPAADPLGLDLLSKLLVYEPSSRLSAQQSLLHPYFDDLDKSAFR